MDFYGYGKYALGGYFQGSSEGEREEGRTGW